MRGGWFAALALLWTALAGAQTDDPQSWLRRMSEAAATLNYSGTFVYRNDLRSETSRIVHVVGSDGSETERLEVLDGPPREVICDKQEVRAYLPSEKRVIVDRRVVRGQFPALVAGSPQRILDRYELRLGERERVAGFETQAVLLTPRDGARYGQWLWAEVNSGLPVKAKVVDDKGRAIEEFSFTQLTIGGAVDRDEVRSRLAASAGSWRVESLQAGGEAVGSDIRLRAVVPGFVKESEMRRRLREGEPDVTHILYSDGLAAVSLFVAAQDPRRPTKTGVSTQGAVNVVVRQIGDHVVTVLGEVPMATVRAFADAVEIRKP